MRRGEMPGERLLGVPLLEDSEPAPHIGVCPEAIGATPWLLQRLGSQCASPLDHARSWIDGLKVMTPETTIMPPVPFRSRRSGRDCRPTSGVRGASPVGGMGRVCEREDRAGFPRY